MPRRIRRSRPNQLAAEPESAVMMQLSGRRGESSQKMRCGLSRLLPFSIARFSSTFHHDSTDFSIFCRQARSVFRCR